MVQRYGTSSAPCENGIYVLHGDYEALEAEARALREDAERYRWLRGEGDVSVRDVFGSWCEQLNDGLDAAIDAARGAK